MKVANRIKESTLEMKYLHIFQYDTNLKFTNPYINFIESNFIMEEHSFCILGKIHGDHLLPERHNVVNITRKIKDGLLFLKSTYSSEKIFLHSLNNKFLVGYLFIQPWLLKKCYWCIWGWDLYRHTHVNRKWSSRIYEYVRKQVIKNIYGFITQVKGDYELAQKWYGSKGKHYYSFAYQSNLYKNIEMPEENCSNDVLIILIGNSADSTNDHIGVFNKLKKIECLKDVKYEIICPLSYGDNVYKNQIINIGRTMFGDKFKPLTEFISYEEYSRVLNRVDVGLFNHKHQHALGNIITLLGLGKKVYIREDITTWQFCKEHSLTVFSIDNDLHHLTYKLPKTEKEKNIENIRAEFSEKKLVRDWIKIFSDKKIKND